MSTALKTFDITYTLPGNLVEDTDISEKGVDKSLNFHRFMRHSRECHKSLLEFLMQNSLLEEVGGSELVANERRTLIECSDRVAERIRKLPFVESAEEQVGALSRHFPERGRKPPLQNR